MTSLDALDAAQGGPFYVKYGDGARKRLPGPASLPWRELTEVLRPAPAGPVSFVRLVCDGASMPLGKAEELRDAWALHYDLPDHRHAHRLTFLMERYFAEIEFDLTQIPGCPPLGELWRRRRWRFLLNVIDHLPRTSWYSQAVANDEEHAKLLAEAQVEQPGDENAADYSPPLVTFTPEVEMLQMVVNELRILRATYQNANTPKGAPRAEPTLLNWPRTAIQRARALAIRARKKAKHEALVARVLPHKRKTQAPVE